MPYADIFKATNDVRSLMPEGARSPSEITVFLRSILDLWKGVRIDFNRNRDEIDGVEILDRDALAFETRLQEYMARTQQALANRENEEDLAPFVRPLFYRSPGLHVIDGVYPFAFGNLVDAGTEAAAQNTWAKAIGEALEELPERIGWFAGEVGKTGGRVVGGTVGGFLGGGGWIGAATLGLAAYLVWRPRK